MAAGLDTAKIIDGVCLDALFGGGYKNTSFGCCGYCLSNDTKQLIADYESVPQNLIQAIVSSISTRKDFIADTIFRLKPRVIEIRRLVMKLGSDNFKAVLFKVS